MTRYELKGSWYTPNELAELSGIAPHTLRDRLRRGYSVEEAVKENPVHDSIKEFTNASWWEDWIGLPISDLYEIYWKWCVSHKYQPVQIQGFSRQLMSMFPVLKTIPSKRDGEYKRIIRLRR